MRTMVVMEEVGIEKVPRPMVGRRRASEVETELKRKEVGIEEGDEEGFTWGRDILGEGEEGWSFGRNKGEDKGEAGFLLLSVVKTGGF